MAPYKNQNGKEMFAKLLRELEKLQGTKKVSVPIKADKECPSKECLFQFKVQEDDWKNIFRDE